MSRLFGADDVSLKSAVILTSSSIYPFRFIKPPVETANTKGTRRADNMNVQKVKAEADELKAELRRSRARHLKCYLE